jgi:DNA-binding response OmpR family regulator
LGAATAPPPRTLSAAGLSLDRGLFALTGEAGSVTLTPTEFRLLEYLMERPGVVVAADELLEKVWGFFPHTGSRDVVRTHMRNLRAKITTPPLGGDRHHCRVRISLRGLGEETRLLDCSIRIVSSSAAGYETPEEVS